MIKYFKAVIGGKWKERTSKWVKGIAKWMKETISWQKSTSKRVTEDAEGHKNTYKWHHNTARWHMNTVSRRAILRVVVPFCAVLVWGISLMCMYAENVENDIASSVVRLHILANSNSEEDQQLKLEVRDYLLEYMREKMATEVSSLENETRIEWNGQHSVNYENVELPSVEVLSELAEDFVKAKGKDYNVRAEYCKTYFPTKKYNNVTFPAGQYNALRVMIGEGAGENWWCVMYPPLCMTNAYEGGLSEESQEMLQEQMSEESYEIINSGSETNFQMKFKVVEWYGEIKESISNWWNN